MAIEGERHFIGRVAQKVIIQNASGAVLLVRTVGEERFAFPGGRLNEGEDPETGVIREVEEEIGAHIKIERPLATGAWVTPTGVPHFLVTYLASLEDPKATLTPAKGEIEEIRWVQKEAVSELPLFKEYALILLNFFESRTIPTPLPKSL